MLLYCLDLWPASLVAGGVSEGSLAYRALSAVSRFLYRRVDWIAVTSESFREYLSAEHDIDPQIISHVPQYADDAPAASVSPGDALSAPGFGADVDLVFTGNVGRLQSLETVVRTAGLLKDDSRFRFHIIGDGSGLEDCRILAAELGLSNLTFYGRRPQDEMLSFYAKADALMITMRDEPALAYTLPRKMQSYMAAGRPIIGAIGGEARRVIEDAGCGFCVPPEDHEQLAAACRRFATAANRERMAQNALEYYRAHYDKPLFFDTMLNLMHRLVAERASVSRLA